MKATHFILFAILCLSNLMSGYAQQHIRIKNAVGTCVIANISPERAKENALFSAKIEALRRAGIPENLLANVTQIGDVFVEASDAEIGGDIAGYEIISDNIKTTIDGRSKILTAEVVINADVVKYNKKRDPSFQLQVQGIKNVYKEGQMLSFWVTPYQDGYLRIFLFEENGNGTQLYPDEEIEPDMLFVKNGTIKFPSNDRYYYVLSRTDKTKFREINRILFLFFKDNIRFAGDEITLQSVLNWKAGVSPDKRTQVFHEFTIER